MSGAWAPPLPPRAVKGMRGRAFCKLVAADEMGTACLIAFWFQLRKRRPFGPPFSIFEISVC
jgi:hypothetical protein